MAEQTRDRVRAVAAELGYRPSRAAQALRTGRHRMLSLVVSLEDWAWWAPLLEGASSEAQRQGYNILVHPLQTATGGGAFARDLKDLSVDGLVLVASKGLEPDTGSFWDELELPLIYIDDLWERPSHKRICANNSAGGALVGRHLRERQRKQPIILTPEEQYVHNRDRIAGFFEGYHQTTRESDRFDTPIIFQPEASLLNGLPALADEMENGLVFDAVFATSDYLAVEVLRLLRRKGIDVPKEVSVVGFDDERAALLVDPRLTTVHQPLKSMGALAVQQLLAELDKASVPAGVLELDVELIVRESS